MDTILELHDISYAYHTPDGETMALEHINFQMRRGEFLAVIGPSGCGKSTLLSLICGLLTPERGTIVFQGHSLDQPRNIGYMLQRDQLLEWRSIYKNVLLGLEIQHRLTKTSRDYARTLLCNYGLGPFLNSRPSELSGGMRQRVALIRTLVLEPDLLLLDEPFSALDYQTRLTVGDDIGQIIRQEQKSAILVTHDLAEAISLADRVLILSDRPATIQSVLVLSFPPEKNTPLARRDTSAFKQYFHSIWKELKHHELPLQGADTISSKVQDP